MDIVVIVIMVIVALILGFLIGDAFRIKLDKINLIKKMYYGGYFVHTDQEEQSVYVEWSNKEGIKEAFKYKYVIFEIRDKNNRHNE